MSDSPVYVTLSSDKIRLLWKSLAQVAVFLVWNVNYKVAVVLSFLGFGFVVYFNIRYNGTNKETSCWLKWYVLCHCITRAVCAWNTASKTLQFRVSMQQRFHKYRRFNFKIRWNIWPLLTLKNPISEKLVLENHSESSIDINIHLISCYCEQGAYADYSWYSC